MSLTNILKHGYEQFVRPSIGTFSNPIVIDGGDDDPCSDSEGDRGTGNQVQQIEVSSVRSYQLVSDVSSMRCFKGRSLETAKTGHENPNQRMYDSPGAAQRRGQASACSIMASQEGNVTPKLFRLRCWEAWRLQENEEWLCNVQLSHEGRSDSDFVWTDTGCWLRHSKGSNSCQSCKNEVWGYTAYKIELIDYDYQCYTIWCLRTRGTRSRPWILFAAEAEGGGLHYLVAQPTSQYEQIAVAGVAIYGQRPEHKNDCRMVELEYQEVARFQTAAALREWSSKFQEDFFTDEIARVSEELRGTNRRLLRYVSRPRSGVNVDGRIQRPEDHTVYELVISGSSDDLEDQGLAETQNNQSSIYCDEQLDPGAGLPQSDGEESDPSPSLASSFSGSDTPGTPGSGQYSMAESTDSGDAFGEEFESINLDDDERQSLDPNPRPTKRSKFYLSRTRGNSKPCYKCWEASITHGDTLDYDGYYCSCIGAYISYDQCN